MTNRELLVEQLGFKDPECDKVMSHFINCPHLSEEYCNNPHEYGTSAYQCYCDGTCKVEWLNQEVDPDLF